VPKRARSAVWVSREHHRAAARVVAQLPAELGEHPRELREALLALVERDQREQRADGAGSSAASASKAAIAPAGSASWSRRSVARR
jgi:hypothetical protein